MNASSIAWKRAQHYAAALVTLAVAGCGGLGVLDFELPDCAKVTDKVSSLRVNPSAMSLRIGDKARVGVLATGASNEFMLCPPPQIWSSSNPAVAAVNGGEVTATSRGTTWVKVEMGGKADSSEVKVVDATIASLTITEAVASLLIGQTAGFGIAAADSAGNPLVVRTVAWWSSDQNVAPVSASGMVTARSAGVVTIRATVEQATATIRITISDDPPAVKFLAVSAGHWHSCALVGGGAIAVGTAYCWGFGGDGQLGAGARASSRRPVAVSTTRTFARIVAGMGHSCAIDASGATFCWGQNQAGELGDGSVSARTTPVQVATPIRFNRVAIGGSSTCALDVEGRLYCWGWSAQGSRTAPVPMAEHLRFSDIAGGWSVLCGLTTDGKVYCWGRLAHNMEYSAPTMVSGQTTFTQFDVGDGHVCGLTDGAEMYCWGQVHGFPAGTGVLSAPTRVPGAPSFSSVAAGGLLTCGVVGARAYCFGSTYLSTAVPGAMVAVPLKHGVTSISAGSSHACAIDGRGGAWCWGRNVELQIGAGEGAFITEPLQLRIP